MSSSEQTSQPAIKSQPPLSLVGKTLSDRYRIEALLGEGGMGAVYLAEHVLMHKRLAVKVLHPEMLRMPEIVARFEREAMAAAHIEHPNVAAATDFGKLDDGSFFLVLEYIEGASLRDLVDKGPLPTPQALHIAEQIASALARAHSLGIVHRDLKPENVMLVDRSGDKDFVKVLDFGIAKVPVGEFAGSTGRGGTGTALTQLGMVYGTPEYMAPEQALGEEVDLRADLYALGVMLYEMLVGVRPFESESKVALLGMKVTQSPPPFRQKNPTLQVAAPVEAMTMRLIEREAAKRFQTAQELIDVLQSASLGEAATERPRAPLGTPLGLPMLRSLVAAAPVSAAQGSPASSRFSSRAKLISLAVLVVSALLLWLGRGEPARVDGSPAGASSGISWSLPLLKRTASESAIGEAIAKGPTALEELSSKYPEDPAVFRALVHADFAQRRTPEALKAVARLLTLDDKATLDPEIQQGVTMAAQGAPDVVEPAMTLLEGPFGAKGVDLLFELSTNKAIPSKFAARIKQSLAKPEVRAHAAPSLSVLLDLKSASTCEAKKTLLPRAQEHGDARLVPLLRSFLAGKGCGFLGLGDCYPCLHKDGALGAALAAIEARDSGAH